MSWKFEKDCVRDGDIVEPTEFRKNINEFVGELNGYLDSDNVAKGLITKDLIKRNALPHVLFPKKSPALLYIFDHQQSGWIDRTKVRFTNEAIEYKPIVCEALVAAPIYDEKVTYVSPFYQEEQRLPTIEFDADEDGLVMVEFTGSVQWMPQVTDGQYTLTKYRNSSTRIMSNELYAVVETIVTGVWLSESTYQAHTTQWQTPSTYHDGALLFPGAFGYWKNMETDTKSHQAFILCSMWRITVNGMAVAETGPIGNDYSAHPINLVGAIPIEGGKNNIIQVEVQFVWYSPGLDQYKSSSSNEGRLFNQDMDAEATPGTVDGPSCRLDCSLFNQNLIATYRKR